MTMDGRDWRGKHRLKAFFFDFMFSGAMDGDGDLPGGGGPSHIFFKRMAKCFH